MFQAAGEQDQITLLDQHRCLANHFKPTAPLGYNDKRHNPFEFRNIKPPWGRQLRLAIKRAGQFEQMKDFAKRIT